MYFLRKYDNFSFINSLLDHHKERGGLILKDADIAEILKQQNEQYRKLYEEHKKLGYLLEDIDKKRYFTPEEELERKRIQKQKLLKKDSMAEIIRQYKKNHN